MNTNNDDMFNINLIDNLFYLCTNTFSIYILDNLIQYISTTQGRWYKIHFVINFYTLYHLYDKVINLIIDPSKNYIMYDDSNNLSMNLMNYHLSLHIYHIIFFINFINSKNNF